MKDLLIGLGVFFVAEALIFIVVIICHMFCEEEEE